MNNIAERLKQCEIFDQLTQSQLEMVGAICEETSFEADQVIFEEFSSSKELYVILQGQVDIILGSGSMDKKNLKEQAVVATLKRGQSFGELALVDEGLRSASAISTQKDTRLLVIPRSQLIMLCETYPPLGYRLMYNLAADLSMIIRNSDMRVRNGLLASKA